MAAAVHAGCHLPGSARGGTLLFKEAARRAGSEGGGHGASLAMSWCPGNEQQHCPGKNSNTQPQPQPRYFRASGQNRVALKLSHIRAFLVFFFNWMDRIDQNKARTKWIQDPSPLPYLPLPRSLFLLLFLGSRDLLPTFPNLALLSLQQLRNCSGLFESGGKLARI